MNAAPTNTSDLDLITQLQNVLMCVNIDIYYSLK